MKLGLISVDGKPTLIVALDDRESSSLDGGSAAPDAARDDGSAEEPGGGRAIAVGDLLAGRGLTSPASMIDLIVDADRYLPVLESALDQLRNNKNHRLIANNGRYIGSDGPGRAMIDLSDRDWLPPQPDPRKILGVAFNNRRIRNDVHVDPRVPNYFLKSASCLIGHRQSVIIRPYYGNTIPEPELCAIIGRRAKDVPVESALEHVFGYSIIDDITSHGMKFSMDSVATTRAAELMRPEYLAWRRRRSEDDTDLFFVYHTRSKNSDTFGPMGPWITTRDEIADPGKLRLRAWCDGELFSDDTTARYTFSVAELIAEASRFFTLEPGDIISCGTAAKGTGKFPHAHRSVLLQERECRIDIELEGLGTLTHFVRHEP